MHPLSLIAGLLAGLHTATWGMYKDAPHEGFHLRTYFRSIVLGLILGPAIHLLVDVNPATPGGFVLLFGLVYAVERAMGEFYKTFIREQDQSKYTIPMQFAVFGKPVESRGARVLVGLGYVAAAGALALAAWRGQLALEEQPYVYGVLLIGGLGGWFSAFGGAWKDAPIEGFETFKFFRSPAIATMWAIVMAHMTDNVMLVAVAALGFTIATIETYKTFFFPSKPRGKFQGKPILFPDVLRWRGRFVPLYVAIWLVIIVMGIRAFVEARPADPLELQHVALLAG
jgi:hypothetical protein